MLRERNVRRIVLVGDSYVRHTYEALLDLLTNDFERGAYAADADVPPQCLGDGQVEESTCRHYVIRQRIVCESAVDISLHYGGAPRALDVFPQSPDVVTQITNTISSALIVIV